MPNGEKTGQKWDNNGTGMGGKLRTSIIRRLVIF
jgi:hypothetical protein